MTSSDAVYERLSVEPAVDVDGLATEWRRLAAASGNVFATWEWAETWLQTVGRDCEPDVHVASDGDGAVRAILPLCVARRRPFALRRLVGAGPADQLGPICAPEDAAPAMHALSDAMRRRGGVLLAEQLPGELAGERPLGGLAVTREASPYVEVEGRDWDGYLATRSSNFRSQVRRKERKLQREHGLGYRLADDPGRLTEDMRTLFELHRARWSGEGAGVFDGPLEEFHQAFAARALEAGWLRLWIAEVEDRPVAAWYGFRYGGDEWYYQFGWDSEWERYSIGLVLLAHTLRSAIEDGVVRYRLLRGDEGYKQRFATADDGLVTGLVGYGPVGRLAVGAASGVMRSPRLRSALGRAAR